MKIAIVTDSTTYLTPEELREKIDHYMKNYNESMMMLDYLEAESIIKKNTGTNDKWFKRIDSCKSHSLLSIV